MVLPDLANQIPHVRACGAGPGNVTDDVRLRPRRRWNDVQEFRAAFLSQRTLGFAFVLPVVGIAASVGPGAGGGAPISL